jgi:ribose 5-phosphate isomerase B
VLARRKTDRETAEAIVRVWLATPFEGGRHQRRVDKIDGAAFRSPGKLS